MKTDKIVVMLMKNQERRNVQWTCKDGKLYFKHKDRWIEEVKFNKHYPKYEYEKFNDKGNLIGKNYL